MEFAIAVVVDVLIKVCVFSSDLYRESAAAISKIGGASLHRLQNTEERMVFMDYAQTQKP